MNEYDKIMEPIRKRKLRRRWMFKIFIGLLWVLGIALGVGLAMFFRR